MSATNIDGRSSEFVASIDGVYVCESVGSEPSTRAGNAGMKLQTYLFRGVRMRSN
jgi:hypothetical protein